MAIDTTIGGPGSQSFCSVTTADDYFSGRLFTDLWDNAITAERESALVWATRILNAYEWRGTRSSKTQALAWPRSNVYTLDTIEVASDVIPDFIVSATCEMVLYLLGSSATNELDGVTGVEIGPIKFDFEEGSKVEKRIPEQVSQFINRYVFNNANSVRILRA